MWQTVERVSFSERWIADGFAVAPRAGFLATLEVDMSGVASLIAVSRQRGERVTYTHAVVRAAALALSRTPNIRPVVAGYRRLLTDGIDVGLSVAGESSNAPVMVLRDCARKTIVEIAREVAERAPGTRAEEKRLNRQLDRWGWLIPVGTLRRALLRKLFSRVRFRHALAGSLNVSCLAEVDALFPIVMSGTVALAVGKVRPRPVAIPRDGDRWDVGVRPTAYLCCSADHAVWDGARASRFLTEVRSVLEGEELASEVQLDQGVSEVPRLNVREI